MVEDDVSQLRLNPLTGRWVTVASDRSTRPADFARRSTDVEGGPSRPCPFCPGNEESTPPAAETYGPEGTWLVRVVPNLYPAFSGDDALTVEHLGPVFTQARASGAHEVLVLSPDHGASWPDLDDGHAGLLMEAVRDRLEEHARHPNIRYTQAIVNHGREAGASLAHPHGQLLGMPFVPGELAEELAGFTRFGEACLLCTTIEAEVAAGHRVVQADDQVVVVAPYWSGSPFELLVLPVHHDPHLTQADPRHLASTGRAIRDVLVRLRRTVGDVAYNVVFHTAPHHHRDRAGYHWHVHLVPRITSVAGFEQGTGVLINIVAPERAAQSLAATD
jgi:UDPglucose--hexose-1-phosphate uridylyltransferase